MMQVLNSEVGKRNLERVVCDSRWRQSCPQEERSWKEAAVSQPGNSREQVWGRQRALGGGVGRGEVGVVRGVNGPESFGERER